MLPGHAYIRARAQVGRLALSLVLVPACTCSNDQATALRKLLKLELEEAALCGGHGCHELVHHLSAFVRGLLALLAAAGNGRELAVELDGGGVLPALDQAETYKVLDYGD